MRRLLIILLCTSVAGTLLAGPATADGPSQEADKTKVLVPPPTGKEAVGPLVELRNQLRSITDEAKSSGYVGMAVDPATNELTLYWHGAVPALAARLRSAPPSGSRLRIASSPYSLTQLLTEARRLAAAHQKGSTPIGQVGVLPDFSGLSVAVQPQVNLDAARHSITSDVKLAFTTAPAVRLAVDRLDDAPPFWGGSAVANPAFVCSTAFAVRDRFTGVVGMLTAYHCGMNENYTTLSGRYSYGRTTEGNAGYDIAVITGQTYNAAIYTGGYTSSRGETSGACGHQQEARTSAMVGR